jgi:hypothetical protein
MASLPESAVSERLSHKNRSRATTRTLHVSADEAAVREAHDGHPRADVADGELQRSGRDPQIRSKLRQPRHAVAP